MRDNRRDPNGHHSGGAHRAHRGPNGVRPEGMRAHSTPFPEHGDAAEPVDLMAVQADDELINALAAGMAVSAPGVGGYDADDRVAAILAAWKADVDAEPMPELVDIDTAVSTVMAARPSRRARHLAPVAAAAAFIVLAIGGVTVGSYSAEPDDVLWPVSKVLYSERAESVEAAARVEMRIANAKTALVRGQPIAAAMELEQAETDLAAVRPEEGLTELAEVQDFLIVKALETPEGTPADPGAPLLSQPSRPVPPGASVTSPPQPAPDPASSTSPAVTGNPANPGPTSQVQVGPPPPSPGPEVSTPPTTEPAPTTAPGPSATTEGGPGGTATPGAAEGRADTTASATTT